jgi:hypothetical protein
MFTLHCTSYADGETIPLRCVYHRVKGGENRSPGIEWSDPPSNTRSFALTIIDPHPVARNWVHWIVWDIPFQVRGLPEGASRTEKLPAQCREAVNSFNEMGYGGPVPPPGSGRHPYVMTLYALNVPSLPLRKDVSLGEFLRKTEGKVIEEASMTGYYER